MAHLLLCLAANESKEVESHPGPQPVGQRKTVTCCVSGCGWKKKCGIHFQEATLAKHMKIHSGSFRSCQHCGHCSDVASHFDHNSGNYHTCNEVGAQARRDSMTCMTCKKEGCCFVAKNERGLDIHARSHTGVFTKCRWHFCNYTSQNGAQVKIRTRHKCRDRIAVNYRQHQTNNSPTISPTSTSSGGIVAPEPLSTSNLEEAPTVVEGRV